MSLLKRKSKIQSIGDKWVNSQAAILHEHTKYSEMTILKKALRMNEYAMEPRNKLETVRNFKEYLHEKSVLLNKPELTKHDFVGLLQSRRSSRNFSSETVQFQELSNLLGWSAGVTKKNDITDPPELAGETVNYRAYPSGGSLYPCETYVIALNINELDRGVYHYDSVNHALDPIDKDIKIQEIENCFFTEGQINNIACIIVVTSVFERCVTKYGDRGYRLSLLEAGHLVQNILLSATAQNLASVSWGGFHDNTLATMLKTDVISEAPIHAALIGKKRV